MLVCASAKQRIPLSIAGVPVTSAETLSAYAGFTVSGTGGISPYLYSFIGSWPSGISINSSTGVVSGTPTQAGTFAGLSVRVTDRYGLTSDIATFTLAVAAATVGASAGMATVSGVGQAINTVGVGSSAGAASVSGVGASEAATTGSSAGVATVTGFGPSLAWTNFQARSGLTGSDATHYSDLLDGLTADGLFNSDGTSSKLDALYILAAPDSATALLNLVQDQYNLTANGSVTFTSNRGYTASGGYLDTGFNPSTAVSAKFQLLDAHYSAWVRTNSGAAGSNSGMIGSATGAGTENNAMFVPYTGSDAYFRCNGGSQGTTVTLASNVGHFLTTRTGSSSEFAYQNAVNLGITPVAADSSFFNVNFLLVGWNGGGGPNSFTQGQVSSGTIGGGLTSGQVTALQSRLATFMAAVGA